jgi:type IV pilus assembly protein PilW
MNKSYFRQRGFSLVEVMAGLLIGLVTVVVIFQVLAVSEGYKRSTTGGAEAIENGAVSLYLLERDIRQAGAGLERSRFGDQINASDGGARVFNFVLAPVVINPGAGNQADTITVLYSNSSSNGDIKTIQAPGMANATDPMSLSSSYGLSINDLFIIAAPGVNGSLGMVAGPDSDADGIFDGGNVVEHADSVAHAVRYNGDGFPVAYPPGAFVMNLGQRIGTSAPGLNQYAVVNNRLTIARLFFSNDTDELADNIITVKAQYGIDTDGDNVVDSFALNPAVADGLPAGVAFNQVRAIRLAVLTRIGAREKNNVAPAAITLWPDSAVAPTTAGPVINIAGDDRQYRYRIFTTTIPLRNVVW